MSDTIKVNFPESLDILYVRTERENTMTIRLEGKQFGPVPTKEAFAVLREKIMRECPNVWSSKQEYAYCMMMIHFKYMSDGCNKAGISYPVTE